MIPREQGVSDLADGIVLLFAIFIAGLFGAGVGSSITNDSWRMEMIERGYAHYDANTGKWDWNEARISP